MSSAYTRGRTNKKRRHSQSSPLSKSHKSSSEDRLLNGTKIEVPWGPIFYPSVQDMEGSPLDYIDKIRPIAQRYGICKIVPPEAWKKRDFFGTLRVKKMRARYFRFTAFLSLRTKLVGTLR